MSHGGSSDVRTVYVSAVARPLRTVTSNVSDSPGPTVATAATCDSATAPSAPGVVNPARPSFWSSGEPWRASMPIPRRANAAQMRSAWAPP